jgi:cytochrome P450
MTEQRQEDWNPRSEDVLKDQIKAYDALRQNHAVMWSDFQQWTLLRHQDVLTVLEDHHTFSNAVSSHLSVPNGMDPPQHTPYRKLIEPYFAPEPMARFEPICRRIAKSLTQALPKNTPVDAMEHYCRRFALHIQCAFMGWPEDLHMPLARWLQKNHEATLARDRAAMNEVAREFDGYIHDLLAVRLASETLPDDVTTSLMRETVNGQLLTEEEIVSLLRNWTVGELATISASVSILLHFLAEHPDLFQALKDKPEDIPAAIDEILRIDAPLISNRRITTREVELGGRTIPAGEKLTLLWASANRDEAVFGNPDQFCPHQNAGHNLLYGAGVHICPGAPLARMELQILIEELLLAIERVQVAEDIKPERAVFPTGGFSQLTMIFCS